MDIIIVGHNDINVKDVEQHLHGNTKKKVSSPKYRLKKEIVDCYAEGMGKNGLR